jgi:putative hydrolases of HD superfamily
MVQVSEFADFICELDKLKAVKRMITLPVDGERKENSAEHSWHVALTANMLSQYANKPIDVTRVIRMILIHDIVEIDAGDMFAFNEQQDHDAQAEKEVAAAKRIFGLLPTPFKDEMLALWL